MAHEVLLRLEAVSKRFPGGVVGLDAIDLDVVPGEFLSLLGPSGCGKTTSLRVMAGFETPTAGRVLLDGKDITALRPFDRPVNTVFQDYALFPHMNVAENVGFGLSLRKIPAADQRKRVAEALDMVGLGEKISARVSELSGGQRQRVALARAIVCEPRILLLDEPLSALDAHLREHMQMELKRLQASLGMTFVMVTHDQTEAMSISNRIVVMNKGRIEQVASPATLYDRPATKFVAGFIGTMNLLESRFARRDGTVLRYVSGDLPLELAIDRFNIPADGGPDRQPAGRPRHGAGEDRQRHFPRPHAENARAVGIRGAVGHRCLTPVDGRLRCRRHRACKAARRCCLFHPRGITVRRGREIRLPVCQRHQTPSGGAIP